MSHDLESVAVTLVADGKGILAADETVPTLTKRFDTLGIPSTDGMAGTRTWGPAGRPCTNGLAATAPPASGGTQMRWRPHRWLPAVLRIAASGATTDVNGRDLGICSTQTGHI
jgi:hypothetical protein